MREPPAAVWRVHPDRLWQWFCSLLCGVTGAVIVMWSGQHLMACSLPLWCGSAAGPMSMTHALVAGTVAVTVVCGAAVCGWRWGTQSEGRLLWTGSQWRWQAPVGDDSDVEVTVEAAFDTGSWLLLRLRSQPTGRRVAGGTPEWLSLRGPRGGAPGEQAQWVAFRAAVYSAASRSGGPEPVQNPFTLNDRSGL